MPVRMLDKSIIIPNKVNRKKQSARHHYKTLLNELDAKSKLAKSVDKCNALIREYLRLRAIKMTVKRAQKMIDILDRLAIESRLTQNRIALFKLKSDTADFSQRNIKCELEKNKCLSMFDTALTELQYCCDLRLLQDEKETLYSDMNSALGRQSLLTHNMHLIISQKNAKSPMSVSEFLRSRKVMISDESFEKLHQLSLDLSRLEKKLKKKRNKPKVVQALIDVRQDIIHECKQLLTQPSINDSFLKELWRVIHCQSNHISNLSNACNELLRDKMSETREREKIAELVSECLQASSRILLEINHKNQNIDQLTVEWQAVVNQNLMRTLSKNKMSISMFKSDKGVSYLIENPRTGECLLLRQISSMRCILNRHEISAPCPQTSDMLQHRDYLRFLCEPISHHSVALPGDKRIFFDLIEHTKQSLAQLLPSSGQKPDGVSLSKSTVTYLCKLLQLVSDLNEHNLYLVDTDLENIRIDDSDNLKISNSRSVLSSSKHRSMRETVHQNDLKSNDWLPDELTSRNNQMQVLSYMMYQIMTCENTRLSQFKRIGCRNGDPFMFDFSQFVFQSPVGKILAYHILKLSNMDAALEQHLQTMQDLQREYSLLQRAMQDKGVNSDVTFIQRSKKLIEAVFLNNEHKIHYKNTIIPKESYVQQFQNAYGIELGLILRQVADYMKANAITGFSEVLQFMLRLNRHQSLYRTSYLSELREHLLLADEYFAQHPLTSVEDVINNISEYAAGDKARTYRKNAIAGYRAANGSDQVSQLGKNVNKSHQSPGETIESKPAKLPRMLKQQDSSKKRRRKN